MAGGLDLARELSGAGKQRLPRHEAARHREHGRARNAQCRRDVGATFLTVHAHDAKTLRAALAGKAGTGLKILGVTVLTNLDAADIREQGIDASPADLVARRAALARDAGCDGVVASGLEAARVRAVVGPRMAIVTPGIRLPGGAAGDQARVAGPRAGDRRRCRLSRRRPADHRGDRSRRGGRGLRAAYRGRACATREGSGS